MMLRAQFLSGENIISVYKRAPAPLADLRTRMEQFINSRIAVGDIHRSLDHYNTTFISERRTRPADAVMPHGIHMMPQYTAPVPRRMPSRPPQAARKRFMDDDINHGPIDEITASAPAGGKNWLMDQITVKPS